MSVQEFLLLALKLSVLTIVFSLGLKTNARDVLYLLTRPSLLLRSILAMNIVMLAFALVVILIIPMAMPVKIALIALALSPVPPILPSKQTKAGGTPAYSVSLLVCSAIVSIVMIPMALSFVGHIFDEHYGVDVGKLIIIILMSIILPLCLGFAVRFVATSMADKMARPVGLLAMALLILSALPIAYSAGIVLWQLVGNGVVIFLLLFSVLGLAVGHRLGGPDDDDRTVLALATATRHPAIALALATFNFPEEKTTLAVMLWHLVFAILVSIPYIRWRKEVRQAGLHQ